jgi:protein required for attachment to host cells
MSDIWLVVANASRASIYVYRKTGLELVQNLLHPESRAKGRDLVSDRHGKNHPPEATMGIYSEHTDPKQVEADRFALQVAKIFNEMIKQAPKTIERVFIFATPHFHGLFNKHLHKEAQKISQHIQKDYTGLSKRELEKFFKQELGQLKTQ